MTTRQYFHHKVAKKFPKEEEARLMNQYDQLIALHNGDEDKVLDIIQDAMKKLAVSLAATDFRPVLSPVGNAIFETLETANKYRARSSREILKEKIDRFNKALSNAQILVDGKLVEPEVFASMRVTIPAALRVKEKLYESYAASAVKNRIKELTVVIKL